MKSTGSSAPRPRPQRSCNTCTRRKVGCDKARPVCGRCQRAGLDCSYGSTAQQSGPLRFVDETASIISGQTSVTERVERLDHLVNSYANSQCAKAASGPSDSSDPSTVENVGHLVVSEDQKSRYVAPSFFGLIRNEITAINDLLHAQMSSYQEPNQQIPNFLSSNSLASAVPSFSSPAGSSANYRRRSSHSKYLYGDIFPQAPAWAFAHSNNPESNLQQPYLADEGVSTMLDQSQIQVLVWAYISGWHTNTPVFHGPSFLAKLQNFDRWIHGEIINYIPDPNFLALRAAVLFAGSVVCPTPQLQQVFGVIDREALSTKLYEAAIEAIRKAKFPQSPSLESFAAFLIVDSTWLREEEPLTCIAFVGLSVRVAQMLGLHKDSSTFPGFSAVDLEVRRRIWRQVLYIDCQVAAASGLPPLISPGSFDVQPVSLTPEALLPSADQSSLSGRRSILGLFQAGRYAFHVKSNQILHILHSAFLNKSDVQRIVVLMQEIITEVKVRRQQILEIEETAIAVYPSILDSEHLISRSESNRKLARYARFIFSMMIMKPYSMLYGQIKRQGLLEFFLQQEPNLIAKCRRFLHAFLVLTECPDFQPWHWCWPGIHQPLHAVMAIIQDLDENPTQETARLSRELVDLALRMSGSQGNCGILSSDDGVPDSRGLNQGGSAAWTFIWQARALAWQKAGFDANRLACPERARDIALDYEDDIMPEPNVGAGMGVDAGAERMTEAGGHAFWGGVPETPRDWMMYGEATDPWFGFDGGADPGFQF